MNQEMIVLYDAIVALSTGEHVYEVMQNVPEDKIDDWKNRLIAEGFYVNVDYSGGETNIYYASRDYVYDNYGEYTMGGWSN